MRGTSFILVRYEVHLLVVSFVVWIDLCGERGRYEYVQDGCQKDKDRSGTYTIAFIGCPNWALALGSHVCDDIRYFGSSR